MNDASMNELQDQVQALQASVRELQDVRAIEELAARYHTLCDGGWKGGSHENVDGLVALWTEDGLYGINARKPPCRGHDEIRAQFIRLRTSMPWILHTVTNPEIEVTGSTATGRFKAIAYYRRDGGSHVVVGSYVGEFVRAETGWLFSSWISDLAHGSVLSDDPTGGLP